MAKVKLDLRFDRAAFGRLASFFASRAKKTKPVIMKAMAEGLVKIVKDEYKNPPEDLRTNLTREIYDQGKAVGNTPKRNAYPEALPLRRSSLYSHLAQAVQAMKISEDHWVVRINPGAKQVGGDPGDKGNSLEAVAAQLETPRPAVVRFTARMAAYLMLLVRGEAGKKTARKFRGDPNALVGAKFLVINPRRSWKVWDRARRRALTELRNAALGQLQLLYKAPSGWK